MESISVSIDQDLRQETEFEQDTLSELISTSRNVSQLIRSVHPEGLSEACIDQRSDKLETRQLKYSIGQVIEPIVTTAVHEIASLTPPERYPTIVQFLMPYHEQLGLEASLQLQEVIKTEIEILNTLRADSTVPVLATEEILEAGYNRTGYRLASFLAGEGNDKASPVSPQLAVAAMHMLEGSDHIGQLQSQISEGVFDKSIAYRVIHAIQTSPEKKFTNGMNRLAALSRFFMQASGIEDPREVRIKMIEHLDAWPNEERQVINTKRDSIAAAIADLQRVSGLRFGDYCTTVSEQTALSENETSFVQMYDHLSSIERPNLHAIFLEMKQSQPFNISNEAVSAVGTMLAKKYETLETGHFELTGINCSMGRFSLEEVTVDSKIKDYMNETGQREKQVEEDLIKVARWMSNLDFKNSQAFGTKKFTNVIRPEGDISPKTKEYPLWEFKPMEAPGLSLKSTKATNIRALFIIMENNKLGLVCFAERSRLYEALNRSCGSHKQSHR